MRHERQHVVNAIKLLLVRHQWDVDAFIQVSRRLNQPFIELAFRFVHRSVGKKVTSACSVELAFNCVRHHVNRLDADDLFRCRVEHRYVNASVQEARNHPSRGLINLVRFRSAHERIGSWSRLLHRLLGSFKRPRGSRPSRFALRRFEHLTPLASFVPLFHVSLSLGFEEFASARRRSSSKRRRCSGADSVLTRHDRTRIVASTGRGGDTEAQRRG